MSYVLNDRVSIRSLPIGKTEASYICSHARPLTSCSLPRGLCSSVCPLRLRSHGCPLLNEKSHFSQVTTGRCVSVFDAEEHHTVSLDRKVQLSANDHLVVAVSFCPVCEACQNGVCLPEGASQ